MSKNSVTKKLITTLALLTCLCGIGTVSVHATPKAVSFNNNSKKITMFATQRKQLKVKLSGKYKKSDVVYSSSNKKVATVINQSCWQEETLLHRSAVSVKLQDYT